MTRTARRLDRSLARRVALAAQGLASPRPSRPVTTRDLVRVLDTVGLVQIDSVNVLTRSHYLPFFSRLGPYDTTLLDRMRDRAPRRMVEYWAHEASLMPPGTWPLMEHPRMRRGEEDAWGGMRRVAAEHPDLVAAVLAEVERGTPRTARQIEDALEHDAPRSSTHWGWNWSLVKNALEHLFWVGQISSAGRTAQFERRYAALGRVVPPREAGAWLDRTARPPADEAYLELVRISLRALGVADVASVADYFRIKTVHARPALEHLVGTGEAEVVAVEGMRSPTYLWSDARRPRRVEGRALLSPFDSMVWHRPRVEALFDFRYRLEIYTPAPQRVHGYYVLPFLLGDELVGRVDLKADRAAGLLRVQQLTWEPGRGGTQDRAELDTELDAMARWLALADVAGRAGQDPSTSSQ